MNCRRCNSGLNEVTHTTRKDGRYKGKQITVIRRRRRCRHCGFCWHTNEHYEDLDDWKPTQKESQKKDEAAAPDIPEDKPPKSKRNPFLPED